MRRGIFGCCDPGESCSTGIANVDWLVTRIAAERAPGRPGGQRWFLHGSDHAQPGAEVNSVTGSHRKLPGEEGTLHVTSVAPAHSCAVLVQYCLS